MGFWQNKKRSFFIPSFDETSMFMIALAFILLFFSNVSLRSCIYYFFLEDEKDRAGLLLLLLLFIAAVLLSLYHVFTKRKKTEPEKHLMISFAVFANGLGGIAASTHILENTSKNKPCIFVLLPIWNIINCILLLALWRFGKITAKHISDRNATPVEAFLAALIIVAIFVICQFVFNLYWAITFSICVVYASSFSEAVSSMFHLEPTSGADENRKESVAIDDKFRMAGDIERCQFCQRTILKTETPWVAYEKLIVCKECYDKIQGGTEKK